MKFLELIRISNWIKNVFIGLPLLFSFHLMQFEAIKNTLIAIIAFSLFNSFFYIINDIADINKDKLHPRKKKRPLASGKVSVNTAILVAICVLLLSIGISYFLPADFKYPLIAYGAINILYSYFLKKINIIESVSIAAGFVIRVLAGCVAIGVTASSWIVVLTFFLALFLAFIKRKSELKLLNEKSSGHRSVLKNYSVEMLDKFIYICATVCVTGYLMYTLENKAIHGSNSQFLVYTTLFVVIGIFRFIQLSDSTKYAGEGDPTTLVVKDRFSQINIAVWVITVFVILY